MSNCAVIGLGFGDEGKGKVVNWICETQECDLVIRFCGGAQAGHNVIAADGRHHCFSQFGSGSFIPGVRTLLSRYHLLDPLALANEASALSQVVGEYMMERHFIDGRCLVVTPYHILRNRQRETEAGENRHGSVGCGIGECVGDSISHPEDVIFSRHLCNPGITFPKLSRVYKRFGGLGPDPEELAYGYKEIAEYLNVVGDKEANRMIRDSRVVFEGAQGTLLDQDIGFAPHNTWSKTTDENVRALIKESDSCAELEVIGVSRCYATRHGQGPFPCELDSMKDFNPGEHNKTHEWQGPFRSGGFDLSLFSWSLRNCYVNTLCINHLDLLNEIPFYRSEAIDGCIGPRQVIPFLDKSYYVKQGVWKKTKDVVRTLEQFRVPVKYLGYGARDITVLLRP